MDQGAFTADGSSILELGSGAGRVTHALLFGSHLVNTAAAADRQAFLGAARAHVAPGGRVLVEWHPPEWFESVRDDQGGRRWTQAFTCRRLGLPALNGALAGAGLVFERWCTGDRTWFAAVPA
ncbi:hypothetical protein [Amycolatopsis speibonae]|uniref:Class I SAM-dependent methyltransferase n=1 Tax=Amycolatopsis speibonae TaxID=1450224 RepID=A0ABV7NQT9_9PSEU